MLGKRKTGWQGDWTLGEAAIFMDWSPEHVYELQTMKRDRLEIITQRGNNP